MIGRRGSAATVALVMMGGLLVPLSGPATAEGDRSADSSGPEHISGADGSGSVEVFIGTKPRRPAGPPPESDEGMSVAQVARAALGTKVSAGIPAGSKLRLAEVTPGTRSSGKTVRFQQVIHGIPLFGGEVVVDLDGSHRVRAVNLESTHSVPPPRHPVVKGSDALEIARTAVGAASGLSESDLSSGPAELWFYDPAIVGAPDSPGARLVWRFDVSGPESAGVRHLVFVDARDGAVLFNTNQTPHRLSRGVCDAGNQPIEVPCTNPVRTEGDSEIGIRDVDDAFTYLADTYTFYSNYLGRDSLDGQGLPLRATVRYCEPPLRNTPCPYDNAYWDGSQMVFGEGEAGADDIVGHELTHGVTQYSSNLVYFYESGAINESLSDVLGEFVDLTNGRGNDTSSVKWIIGEDALQGELRSLKDPPAYRQPDVTGSRFWVEVRPGETSPPDFGWVHTNSGVGNKFGYLITDGGAFNGQTVRGIGINRAARIVYGAQNIMTSTADYRQYAQTLRQSCATLVGQFDITVADCAEVDKALLATEMEEEPKFIPSVPAAPTSVSAQWSQSTILDVTPGDNGGSELTSAEYRVNGGAWSVPDVLRLPPPPPSGPGSDQQGTQKLTMIIYDLPRGRTYDIQVRALNRLGAGAPSATVSLSVPSRPLPPTFPSPSASSPPPGPVPSTSAPAVATQPSAPGPQPGAPTANVPDVPAATPPGKVARLRVKVKGKRKSVVKWRPPTQNGGAEIAGYRVRASKPGGGKFRKWQDTTKTRLAVGKLKPGKKYRIQVAAVTPAGTGPAATKRFRTKN